MGIVDNGFHKKIYDYILSKYECQIPEDKTTVTVRDVFYRTMIDYGLFAEHANEVFSFMTIGMKSIIADDKNPDCEKMKNFHGILESSKVLVVNSRIDFYWAETCRWVIKWMDAKMPLHFARPMFLEKSDELRQTINRISMKFYFAIILENHSLF